MRWMMLGLVSIGLAGCGKAPPEAGEAVNRAAGVAFSYDYRFRLPSDAIAGAQDAHARACEALTPARCRITGMTYRVDDAGVTSASLALQVAAPIARRFGREGVRAIETAGGALVGAEIGGTEAPVAEESTAVATAGDDRLRIERDLARPGLSPEERATLRAQLATVIDRARAGAAAVDRTQASIATSPVRFDYRAGHGTGVTARMSDAGNTLAASTASTLGFTLTAFAVLGPPALLLLALFLLWHHFGRRLWQRMLGHPAEAQ